MVFDPHGMDPSVADNFLITIKMVLVPTQASFFIVVVAATATIVSIPIAVIITIIISTLLFIITFRDWLKLKNNIN